MYFFLKQPKFEKETLIILVYYIKDEKKYFKYSTGQKIAPKHWSFENRMPLAMRGSAGQQNKHIGLVLSKYADFLESLIRDSQTRELKLSKDLLKSEFDKHFKGKSKSQRKKLGPVDAIQDFIDSKNRSGGQSYSWNQKYSNLKLKIEYFIGHNGGFSLDDIDEDWIDRYCGFLRKIKKKPFKPHNDNTLHRNINFLFTFLNWAQGKHHNLNMDKLKNPVKKYQPEDVHLTASEVRMLEELEPKRDSLERVRDLFLIGIYSGQRFSDYSVFEKADVVGDMIIKKAEKTEYESFIPLHNKLLALLEKYEWKLPKISEQKFNVHVKTVCHDAGIKEKVKETVYRGNQKKVLYYKKYQMVGSHTARRTFITLSSEKGMPDHIIMKVTGIRDPKTLMKYKKTNMRTVEESMKKVWG